MHFNFCWTIVKVLVNGISVDHFYLQTEILSSSYNLGLTEWTNS